MSPRQIIATGVLLFVSGGILGFLVGMGHGASIAIDEMHRTFNRAELAARAHRLTRRG